jgi:hypothetical protein
MAKNDILAEVWEILKDTSGNVLKSVLIGWEKRLQNWKNAGGECIE